MWRWEKEDEAREKSYAGERQGLRKAGGHSASTHTVESLKSSRVRTVLHEQLQKHIHIVHLRITQTAESGLPSTLFQLPALEDDSVGVCWAVAAAVS